jgi:hypothetical protein
MKETYSTSKDLQGLCIDTGYELIEKDNFVFSICQCLRT